MLGGCWRRRRRGRTAGVSWILDRALGCLHTTLLVLWDVSHLAFSITTHPVPMLCMTSPLHLLSIMLADQTPNPFNICGGHLLSYPAHPFYPTTEHQSASFPMSWSSFFSSQTFLRAPPHLHSFTLVNDLSGGWEGSNVYNEKACGTNERDISPLYLLQEGRWTDD